jgi:hypothetical protein
MSLSFTIAAGPRQRIQFSGPSPGGLVTTFYCPRVETPYNLESEVPVFITPRNRVARLYAQELGSIFVASYDSQGYGGGIRPRLHTGWFHSDLNGLLYSISVSNEMFVDHSYARKRVP